MVLGAAFFYGCPECISSAYIESETKVKYSRSGNHEPYNRTKHYFFEVTSYEPFGLTHCRNEWEPYSYLNQTSK